MEIRLSWIFLTGWLVVGIVQADPVRIVGQAWVPYLGREGDEQPGMMVEVTAYALKDFHHRVEYREVPFKLAMKEVSDGISMAVAGTTPAEAPELVFGKEPIGETVNEVFVIRPSEFSYKGVESFRGKKLGLIAGAGYGAEVDKARAAGLLEVMESSGVGASEQNLRRLARGEVDVVIEDGNKARYLAKRIGFDEKLVSAGKLGKAVPVYIGFSPKLEQAAVYARQLDEGIAKLRKSGVLAKVLSRYGLKDWAPLPPEPKSLRGRSPSDILNAPMDELR